MIDVNKRELRRLVYVANARLPTEKAHGNQIVRMCEAFSSLGLNVTLLYPFRGQSSAALASQTIAAYYDVKASFNVRQLSNLDVFAIEHKVPHSLFRAAFFTQKVVWGVYAAKVAMKYRADFYFTREPVVAWWLSRSGYSVVLEMHSVPARFSRVFIRRAAHSKGIRAVIALTSHLGRDLVEKIGVPEKLVHVLHDGVDLDRFEADTDALAARIKLGLPATGPLVVYAGQLFPDRGVDVLVQAGRYLPNMTIVLVGGLKVDIERLQGLAAKEHLDNVRFVGHVSPDRIPRYLAAADILALPMPGWLRQRALYSSPMKAFEYMAAGRAIVANDVPALREIFVHGQSVWFAPPDDPKALAEGIRYVAGNPKLRRHLADTANTIVQSYTWEHRARSVLRFVNAPSIFGAEIRTHHG